MFWYIMACVSIAALILSYRVEIASGKENKIGQFLALVAVGLTMGIIYVTYIAA